MPALMNLALSNAACAALLAVLALAAGRWLRRPALSHCLWVLVLVKLLTPPLFPLSLPWLPAEEAPAAVAAEGDAIQARVAWLDWQLESVGPPLPDDVWDEMEKVRLGKTPTPQEKALAQLNAVEAPPNVIERKLNAPLSLSVSQEVSPAVPADDPRVTSLWIFLGGIWALGSVVWFARSVWRLARFQRLLRHAQPAPEPVRALAERLACRLGLRRCPEVLLLPAALPPMVWAALGRARVLLPARLLERLDDEQRAALLAHELAHVRRGDHWVRRLEFLALGLFWWYPVAWLARRRLQAAEEECCDAWVVEEVAARSYASAIVETVDFLADDLAAVPALASGLGRVDVLKRRLRLILGGAAPKRLGVAGRLLVLILALGLLPLVPVLAHSEKKPDQPAAEQPTDLPKPADADEEAIAFRPTPLMLTGGEHEVAALAVSPDGRYLAAGTGYNNRPGEVRVWTVADHKEVLVYATAQGVTTVAFSPDGRYLVSTGFDGQAVVREFPSGKVVCVLPLDDAARLAFASDGKALITVTESKTIKVWNPLTGAEIARLEDRSVSWYCLAVSRDGKYLATGGGEINQGEVAGQVTLWDAVSHKPLGKVQLPKGQSVMSVGFTPDGVTLAAGSTNGTVALWQVEDLKPLGTLEGHENWVKSLTFTPDGKTLITGSHDGTVRLWDVAKQMPITRLDGHIAPTRAVAVSPDGKLAFSGGAERILKVWDLASHKETAGYQLAPEPAGEPSIILGMVYSPDGRLLATAHENGTISLRSSSNGDLLRTLEGHSDAATCLLFSRDGKTLITGSSDRTVRLWDVQTAKVRKTLTGHTSWVYALALSPDGKTLASAGYDKTVRLWDLVSLKEKGILTGHKGAVRALCFAPDGKTLASGAGDHTIKLWDLGTLKEKATLTGHNGTVRALAYAPDGQTLLSGSEDGAVRQWDAATGKQGLVVVHGSMVNAVCFSPAGKYLLIAGMDAGIRFCDAATGQTLQTLRGHQDAVTSLAWAPDGRFVVTAGFDRQIRLWVVTTGPLHLLTGHTGPVQGVCFSPDGRLLVSCSGWPAGDKTIRLWDTKTGKEVRKLEGHMGLVGCVTFAPDGKRLLSGGDDKSVRLWDTDTGKQIALLEGHQQQIAGVCFSPDGKLAASAADDKTARIWNLETNKCLHTLQGHTDLVRGAAFTPDGKQLVTGGKDATLRVWDVARGEQVQLIQLPKGVGINALSLSPDGKRVVVGHGPAVRIVDLEMGKVVRQLDGHNEGALAVAWSPDGKRVLSGGYDRVARLWDVETGRELHVFRGHRNWIWAVNFSPDGRRIVTGGGGARNGEEYQPGNDFTIRLWPMPDLSPRAGRVLKFTVKMEK